MKVEVTCDNDKCVPLPKQEFLSLESSLESLEVFARLWPSTYRESEIFVELVEQVRRDFVALQEGRKAA